MYLQKGAKDMANRKEGREWSPNGREGGLEKYCGEM